HMKAGMIRVRFTGGEFFPQSVYRQSKVVGLDPRGAQPLYRIPALGDRFSRLIDSAPQRFLGFVRTSWEQVIGRLKPQQRSMKTLQQRIVEVACHARAL